MAIPQIKRILPFLVLLFLVLPGCAPLNLSPPPEELSTREFQQKHPEYWKKVQDLLLETLAGVSQVRGLAPPEEIPCRVVTADWAKEKWGREYVEENSQEIALTDLLWKSLLILPPELNLADIYTQWPRSYLMAKSAKKLYFVLENFSRLDGRELRRALAHEVVHFLQDKHFQTPERATFDGEKAWSALVEGDADFTRTKYLERIASEPAPVIKPLTPPSAISVAPQMPLAVARLFRFPYDFGESFISALYRKGGWSEVNQAYLHPPKTTEQILHPERYFLDEIPEQVQALPLDISGWRKAKVDRLGEYFIRVLLETQLPSSCAGEAAQGWGGDRLTCYETAKGYVFLWQIAWDSEDEAIQFHRAFVELLRRKGAQALEPGLWSVQGEYLWEDLKGRQALLLISKDQALLNYALAHLSKANEQDLT